MVTSITSITSKFESSGKILSPNEDLNCFKLFAKARFIQNILNHASGSFSQFLQLSKLINIATHSLQLIKNLLIQSKYHIFPNIFTLTTTLTILRSVVFTT
jgi:hypothetical protein